MKTCPICHTTSFDDMDTCFGCMYSFSDERERRAAVDGRQLSSSQLVHTHASELKSPPMDKSQESTQVLKKIPLIDPPLGKHAAPAHAGYPLVIPGQQARYELVVSLKPVLAEA